MLRYLKHNNITTIKKIKWNNGMEIYMEKYFELSKNIKCIDFVKVMSNALAYIHANNISHRDLKPNNIMVDCNGNIKIIDWGLSGLYSELSQPTTYFTHWYRPIEMLEGHMGDSKKGDIWSLAITILEIYFGFNIRNAGKNLKKLKNALNIL